MRPAAAVELIPATPDMPGFDALQRASEAEGLSLLTRLADEWNSGINVFSKPGEMLLGARREDELVGIGELNVDPYADDHGIGRLRRLYVRPDCRGEGIGAALVRALLDGADAVFAAVNLRAPSRAFAFYERLGFARLEEESITHRLLLRVHGRRRETPHP